MHKTIILVGLVVVTATTLSQARLNLNKNDRLLQAAEAVPISATNVTAAPVADAAYCPNFA